MQIKNVSVIPEGWKETTLGEVADVLGGGTPKTTIEEYWNGKIPWISVVDFNNDNRWITKTEKKITEKGLECSSTQLLNTGDIIISARGTVGKFAQLKKPMSFNQSCYGLRAKHGTDKDFLYYLLKSCIYVIKKTVHGAVFDTITRNAFSKIYINLPPLPEQKAIADVLSSFDNKIELLREQNKTLEAIAQTIFNEWFVRFNFPDENGKPYQASGGKMIDSELGPIPEGWRVGKLDEITDLVTKGTTPTSIGGNFSKKGINFIKAESILETHAFDKSKISFIDEFSNNLLERSKLRENDFLITIAGTIGRFAIVTKALLPANTNQAIAIIRTKRAYSPFYLKCTFSVKGILQKLIGNVVEAVQANLSLTSIKNLKLVIPSDATMNLFEEKFCPQFDKINNNEIQIQTLTTLRDELLPKLMKGKLRVKPTAVKESKDGY
jgi:type I restriction enzyme, S subunit